MKTTHFRVGTPLPRPFLGRATSKIRKLIWQALNRKKYKNIGKGTWIRSPLLITGAKNITLGRNIEIWPQGRLETISSEQGEGEIHIGDETTIHPYSHIAAASRVTIGKGCLFASGVYITDHDHAATDSSVPISKATGLVCADVTIGDSVWIGERAMILKGVNIGSRAVVGAASVVVKDVPDGGVVAGVPAQQINQQ